MVPSVMAGHESTVSVEPLTIMTITLRCPDMSPSNPCWRNQPTTLLKVMLDQGTPAPVKVRAAECVMTHSAKAIEIEDIEARVSELERAAGPKKTHQ
jgi:hypothetical protein